jgi:alkanesulfonate monooxygenase SsuD/methylene tetrahydromethanopterin reductase-like flavin-dependent oxidoreductase (luciferase family)
VTPLHHPARVAEEMVGGRQPFARPGGNIGRERWHDRDFTLAPQNFAERREVMRRSMDTIRRLWRGESVEFTGGRGNAVPVKIFPRPIQKELPMWVTAAGSPETFKLAGKWVQAC